jgi:putative hemolysin
MNEQLLFLIILIILSGYFSGTEIAFVVANKIKIELKARKKNLAAVNAKYFVDNPQTFFSIILIGNNVVNIALASLSVVFLSNLFGLEEFSILIISSLTLLIIGEIIPKYFAHELAERAALLSAIPLRGFMFLIYPAVRVFSALSDRITQSSNLRAGNISHLFDKEDLKVLVEESKEAGVMSEKDGDLIGRVFELGDQRVYEAMTPRTAIVGIEIDRSINEAVDLFIESGFSKIPVFEENLDNIKGIILAKDVFKSPENISSILREVSFIPETKKSFEALNEFLEKKVSIAIVIDEHGGTAGIVTVEDILEELFGEIVDEYDVEENICRKIADGSYIISGRVEIDHINEKYDLNIEEGDYETIAGFITSKLGRIPVQGETVTIDNFTILVARASSQKIDVIKLTPIHE